MSKIVKVMAGACLGMMVATGAFAQEKAEKAATEQKAERATPEQAVKIVKKAIAHINKVGKEAAYADFNAPNNPAFHYMDLYVFVLDMKTGTFLAHGMTPRLVGRDAMGIKDADGKYLMKEFIEVATKKGSGWVDYKWPNPATKTYDEKSGYLERYGDTMIASGIYKQK